VNHLKDLIFRPSDTKYVAAGAGRLAAGHAVNHADVRYWGLRDFAGESILCGGKHWTEAGSVV